MAAQQLTCCSMLVS